MKKILTITLTLCLIFSSLIYATEVEEIDYRENITTLRDTTYTFALTDFTTRFNQLDVGELTKITITSLPTEEQGTFSIGDTAIEEVPAEVTAAQIPTLKFTPVEGFTGTVPFTWKGSTATIDVAESYTTNLIVTAPENTVEITITDGESYTFKVEDFKTIFDTLGVGDLTRVILVSLPSETAGNLQINGTNITTIPRGIELSNISSLTFVPKANYTGTASFTWRGRVGDTTNDTVFTTVLDITAGAPTVTITVDKNTTYRFKRTDFSEKVTELGLGDISSVSIQTLPTSATGTLNFNTARIELVPREIDINQIGLLTFIPTTDYLGTASFTWKAKVGDELKDTVITTNLVVRETADITVEDISYTIDKNMALTDTLTNVQGYEAVYTITEEPTSGTIETFDAQTGEFKYVPATDFVGTVTFKYKATRTVGETTTESNEATVTITVNETEDVIPFYYADMQDHWANYSASHLAAMDILVGEKINDDYFFYPDKKITRADFVLTMLSVLEIEEQDKTVSFTFADDASMPTWLKKYAYTAYEKDIIDGSLENGKVYFNADSYITRAEAAKIINSAMNFKYQNTNTLTFKDSSSIPTWARSAIQNMIGYEIILGYEDNTFRPNETINKGELAEMLYKSVKEKEMESNVDPVEE
ncbi:MAG: hypothetical protein E7311_02940 [Clostridiales bacterium]|nr:hypothetical protein [Clostridiales bacterium]